MLIYQSGDTLKMQGMPEDEHLYRKIAEALKVVFPEEEITIKYMALTSYTVK